MAATNAGNTAMQDPIPGQDFSAAFGTGEMAPSQGEINSETNDRLTNIDLRVSLIDEYLAQLVKEESTDSEQCDDPDCGCQDDEGVIGGMYPAEVSIEAAIDSVIEITQVGITALKDVALNSEDDMAAVEAADSLIGWGQVAAEKIQALEEDALLDEVGTILNEIIDGLEQGEDADRSSR